jgi:hypothetical protein
MDPRYANAQYGYQNGANNVVAPPQMNYPQAPFPPNAMPQASYQSATFPQTGYPQNAGSQPGYPSNAQTGFSPPAMPGYPQQQQDGVSLFHMQIPLEKFCERFSVFRKNYHSRIFHS